MSPIVTVLTPVYNGLPYLKEAIESTLNQTYKDFEYFIIDDASPNKEVIDLIRSYKDPRIRIVVNESNLGVSETINKALSIIESKYIVRLDQDDVSLPSRIQKQIDYLEKHPDISIVCSWEHTIDSEGKRIRSWKKKIKNYGDFLGPPLLGICPIWHPSIAFRRKDMLSVGGFNSKYVRAEDFEVTTRLALNRLSAGIVPEFLVLQREHNQRQSIEFDNNQVDMTQRIQFEAINHFVNTDESKRLSTFLMLNTNTKSKLSKNYLLLISKDISSLFNNIAFKQKLNSEEIRTLKRTFIKRIGFGIQFINFYKFLPSFLFLPLFYILSPFFFKSLRKKLSSIYNALQEIRSRKN